MPPWQVPPKTNAAPDWKSQHLPKVAIANGLQNLRRIILRLDNPYAGPHRVEGLVWTQIFGELRSLNVVLQNPKDWHPVSIGIESDQ